MELDDSFTEKLLQRSKARREYLNLKKTETANSVARKRTALGEEQMVTNQGNVSEDSPKRQRLELPFENNKSDKENVQMEVDDVVESFVPSKGFITVQGLAALKRKYDTDTITEGKVTFEADDSEVNKCQNCVYSTNNRELGSTCNARLANSDEHINQWADYLHQPSHTAVNITSSSLLNKSVVSSSYTLSKKIRYKKSVTTSHSKPSNSNSFSMKMYYTNKASTYTSSKLHNSGMQTVSNTKCNKISESSFPRMPLVAEGNIEGSCGSDNSQMIIVRVCEQPIKVALDTKCIVKSVVKPVNDKRNEELEFQNSEESESEKTISEENHGKGIDENIHENLKGKDSKSCSILNKSIDPATLPLAARKAMFEKAVINSSAKPIERSYKPKLSVAQRAAMFENAAKDNLKPKSSGNFRIPKRFVTFPKVTDIPLPKVTDIPLPKVTDIPSPKVTDIPSPKVTDIPSPKVTDLPSSKVMHTSSSEVMDILPSPVKNSTFLQGTTEVTTSQTESKTTPDLVVPIKLQFSPIENIVIHTGIIQQPVEPVITNQQWKEAITMAIGEVNEISNTVNHWEKLSSSTSLGSRNSEEELSTRQSEGSDDNVYESEEERLEYDSELESVYTERESESECNEKTEVQPNDLSLTDLDDSAMEPYVFNPKRFSAEAGLLSYDVETDSVPPTDDETNSNHGQFWQRKENQMSDPADGISVRSSISETSSINISKNQSCSSSGSTGVCEAEDHKGEEVAEKGSASSSDAPLVHTVSFYRKQRQETRTPPLQKIVRQEHVLISPEDDGRTQVIQERIKLLQEEILRQQTVIGQTSQALNLCHATAEFSGSSEQVEGERLLLIATQKRQSCMNEIQRLKSHGRQGANVADGTGTLTITDIQLPLKREFITALLEGKISDAVHCFLCLIRHGPQVIVTQMVSTSDKIADGSLCFTNHIKLQNLPPDFSVVFEVYTLQTKKENLPHEKKYHIKREHSKNRLAPKGKKNDGRVLLPAISSPGGPQAVRSPSFCVIGYTRFTIQNCNKKCFSLDKVPFTSPLEGTLKVKLQLHAEHNVEEKGFLTMFEDVSGFGAWHRRWCSLNSHHLAYWKYPDDEQRKNPISVIDLKQCITGHVKLVARDICARPHSFRLVTVRPQAEGDKNTLISQSVDTLTTTKHLLSADTKEERISWCNKLNEALTNVRKWDPRAKRPVEEKPE